MSLVWQTGMTYIDIWHRIELEDFFVTFVLMTQEIINYDGTLSKEEIESWKEIEEPGSCNSWTRNVPTASHNAFLNFSYIYPCHRKYWARGLFFGLYTISLGSYKNWVKCWCCIFWHPSMSPPFKEEFPPVPRDAIHDTFVRPGHPEPLNLVHWVRLQVVNRLELHDWIYNCWMTLGKPIALGCMHFCGF